MVDKECKELIRGYRSEVSQLVNEKHVLEVRLKFICNIFRKYEETKWWQFSARQKYINRLKEELQ